MIEFRNLHEGLVSSSRSFSFSCYDFLRNFSFFYVFQCFKAELQKQQQQFIAQKLMAAQRHVAVSHQPQPQKATIVYRSQPVPSNDQPNPKSSGEGRQRGRPCRHDGRYTSGKELFCMRFLFLHDTSFAHFRVTSGKLITGSIFPSTINEVDNVSLIFRSAFFYHFSVRCS